MGWTAFAIFSNYRWTTRRHLTMCLMICMVLQKMWITISEAPTALQFTFAICSYIHSFSVHSDAT